MNYAPCVTVWQGFKSNHPYQTYEVSCIRGLSHATGL